MVRVGVEVETRAPTGQTTAHLVGTGRGETLLVDPADRSDSLDTAVDEHGVEHVAVTHHHPDHVGAVAAYAEQTGATVWARTGRAGPFQSATGIAPDREFRPGQRLPGTEIPVVDTPGHTPEHVAFVTGDGWLTGDFAVAEGSVVVGAPEGDMRAYLSSLRRVHASNPARLLPAHGPVIDDPRAVCERLLRHRRHRERRVLAAVRDGHERPDAIVRAAYDKNVSEVFGLARATVIAHVEKLAVEGRLAWNGERAQ